MEDRVRPDLDERVAATVILAIQGHPRVEDAFVEGDQPVEIGCQERHVV